MKAQKNSLLRSGLTRRLLVGFGSVVIVLFVVAVLVALFLTGYSHTLESVQHENYDSVRYCDGMRIALDKAQAIAQSDGPRVPEIENTLAQAQQEFEANIQLELRNTTLPHELEKSKQVQELGGAVFASTLRLLRDVPIQDRPAFYQEQIFSQYQECRNVISDISQMNLDNFVRVNAQVRGDLLEMRTTIILLLAVGLALSAIFVLLTASGMIRPLMQLTNSVRQVARGNLDMIVDSHAGDEIGELARAFNEMAEKLRAFRRMDLERLARTQQTTQTAIDSLPDAVAVLDIRGKIEIANRTARTHFKLVPGENLRDIRPDWAATFLDPVLKSGTGIVPDGYRSAIQLFDETGERFLLPRAEPMFDSQKILIGVTLVLVEITHLRRADEFKSGLLSAVSHELKTPLTSIRMSMRMLSDKRIGDLNEKQKTLLAAANTDSERLVRTVEDILTIGRVEAGRARLELTDVTMMDVIRRALSTVESAAAEKSISVAINGPVSAQVIRADLNLIACALANLLSNAVKYSPPGTAVAITVTESDGMLECWVQDQGPGIAEEFRTRIFDKFFRVPSREGPSGAGLGLSIASEILQLHGGTVALRQSSSTGSRFVIRLPCKSITVP